MGRFDGATVLITGAAGGLGRGAAKGFAAEGARLVLSDIWTKRRWPTFAGRWRPRRRSLPATSPTKNCRRIW